MIKKYLIFISLILGSVLFVVNIVGLFLPLRSPQLGDTNLYRQETSDTVTLSYPEAMKILRSHPANTKDYTNQATLAINKTVLHYWGNGLINQFHLRVPLTENYLLYGLSYVYPSVFQKYEYVYYWPKALERGAGFCDQVALILAQNLREKGINAKVYTMEFHTVTLVEVDKKTNTWWVADPDYGVVMPYDIKTIENNSKLIIPYYSKAGVNNELIAKLVSFYDINNPTEKATHYQRSDNYSTWRGRALEIGLYILKWLIPVLLILPFIYLKVKRNA